MISVNKSWAQSVSFSNFCKDYNIKKLSPTKQRELYEESTGKKVKLKKGAAL